MSEHKPHSSPDLLRLALGPCACAHSGLAPCGHHEAVQSLIEQFETVLTRWYADDPVTVARLCDEELDRSGALLGRIRYGASSPASERQ